MLPEIGYGALVVAFLVAGYGVLAGLIAAWRNHSTWLRSALAAMRLTWPLISVSLGCLLLLLLRGDFQVAYVYNTTNLSMPVYLKITALWGGQAGSLLFWGWLMSAFASLAAFRNWERDRELLPWVIVVTLTTLAFFIGMVLFSADSNPFVRFWQNRAGQPLQPAMFHTADVLPLLPLDGRGLSPLLRHPGMIFHPPVLYLGFVAFVVPYAFAMAALITGRSDVRWIRITRRWTLAAWLFLSLGLVLGMRWAYDVLGWGGYWGWDPVEVAALNPWLSGTAFLHSVMIQEKRGLFKRWNVFLIALTYGLVIYGTFLTRSGVFSSVHAFAQSDLGPAFFVFIGLMAAFSLGLIFYRWGALHSEGQLKALLSRETVFLLNNLVFMSILAICFWGINYPLLSELVTGQKVTMGPQFYERAIGPLLVALLLLMGVAPLTAWGRSTWKTLGRGAVFPALVSVLVLVALFVGGVRQPGALIGFGAVALVGLVTVYEYARAVWLRHMFQGESLPLALWQLARRNRRRYGGYIIHLGVVLMALGILGIESFQSDTQGLLRPGESLEVSGYRLTYRSLAQFDTPDGRNVTRAVMSVEKDGRFLGEVYPRRDYYYEAQESMTIPGLRSTMEDDVYVILVNWQPITEDGATFKVYHNPLVNWLWVGSLVFLLGSVVAIWPEREVTGGAA